MTNDQVMIMQIILGCDLTRSFVLTTEELAPCNQALFKLSFSMLWNTWVHGQTKKEGETQSCEQFDEEENNQNL